MDKSVSSTLIACLDRFTRVLDSGILTQCESELPISLWRDELGRLRIWAANIGAHRKDQSSADYRLRDASHIRNQTLQLLRNLNCWFDDLQEVLDEPPPGERGEDNGTEEENESGSDDIPEVQQIYHGLVETITCLYQLSMAIGQPTQHDGILKTQKEDGQAFEVFDRENVANELPNAETALVDRLGAARPRRQAALKYHERHHENMAHSLDKEKSQCVATERSVNDNLNLRDDHLDDGLSQTSYAPTLGAARPRRQAALKYYERHHENMAHSLDKEKSQRVATERSINNNLNLRDDHLDDGLSQTSYAPTLFDNNARLTIPVPEGLVFDHPFECPYCYFIITVRDHQAWARHFFQDISPCMCPFERCPTANKLYWRQRDWSLHIQCHHSDLFETNTDIQCPLCNEALQLAQIKRHLSRHLEELVLFAVPRTEMSDDEVPDIHGKHSEDSNKSSKPNHASTAKRSPPQSAVQVTLPTPKSPKRSLPICFNAKGHRVDRPLKTSSKGTINAMKRVKLCYRFHILNSCPYSNCSYKHGLALNAQERSDLMSIARLCPCSSGLWCKDPECIYGHRCSWENCSGKHCRFSKDMHDVDTMIVRELS
jgi:hypothetical protein